MHKYAKFDQCIPCGSRVMSILLTDHGLTDGQTDGRTHTVIIVHARGSCKGVFSGLFIAEGLTAF